MLSRISLRFLSVWLALALPISPPSLAKAAQSPWAEGYGGKMRLVAGGTFGTGLKAGLEIAMEPGWKTYWKVPGDAGIPPMLDFSASSNVKDVKILWPAPTRYGDNLAQLVGYKEWVTFPIHVMPRDPNKPVDLVLDANVGLCSDLCVPVQAKLSLAVPVGGDKDSASEFVIDRDLALVPQRSTEGFKITKIIQKKQQGQPDRLVISADIPKGLGASDLFVEGPKDWYLPLPQPLDTEKGTFQLVLDGLPDQTRTKNVDLTFTLTNGEKAVEQVIRLKN
ncbi:MAG: protein-disulfide reductase DsbD family protein [Cohaesibacter sp.]|nr:protein-disulfide reductase DsbD family protein [Cohaesibacter sp.]MCV6601759.1 protein-disulfide reductase DsbD family protein [Cohaesibacter sp.]